MQEEANAEEDRLDQEELVDIDLEKEAKFDEDVYIGSEEQMEALNEDLWKAGAKNWATYLTV